MRSGVDGAIRSVFSRRHGHGESMVVPVEKKASKVTSGRRRTRLDDSAVGWGLIGSGLIADAFART